MSAEEMMPIAVEEFVATLSISMPAEVFIQLSEGKFILICKAGDKASLDHLSSFQNKELKYVWVKKAEYHKFASQRVMLAGLVINSKDLSVEKKTKVVSTAAKSVFHQLDHMGITTEFYNDAKQITDSMVHLVESHGTLSQIFASMEGLPDDMVRHSMAVSFLSAVIGTAIGWEKRQTIEKLALGGLLHDLGLKSVPMDILNKPLSGMTNEEIRIYEKHVFRGMEMLQSIGQVPDDIVSIVYEHHENAVGQGYPQRIRDIKMHPLARVVGLADSFADLIFPNINAPIPKTPEQALVYMELVIGMPHNREAFRALQKIVMQGKLKAA